MCRFGIHGSIISDNETQFSSTLVTDFFQDLEVCTKFVSVVHPHTNGKTESANKIILKGLKNKLNDAKGPWGELLHEIIWSYHNTHHSFTNETSLSMVNKEDAMMSVVIGTPSW